MVPKIHNGSHPYNHDSDISKIASALESLNKHDAIHSGSTQPRSILQDGSFHPNVRKIEAYQ